MFGNRKKKKQEKKTQGTLYEPWEDDYTPPMNCLDLENSRFAEIRFFRSLKHDFVHEHQIRMKYQNKNKD